MKIKNLFLYSFTYPIKNMNRLKITKKVKDKKIIWKKVKNYIIFWILACCSVIIFNIHPTKITNNSNSITEDKQIIYIFHDYIGNEYVLNGTSHWSSDSIDFLFDKEVPDSVKWDKNQHYSSEVSLANKWENKNNYWDSIDKWDIKDNQVSIENIMTDLWLEDNSSNEDLTISLWNNDDKKDDDTSYTVKEESYNWNNDTLIIEKENNKNDRIYNEINDENTLLNAKLFEYIKDGRVIPILAEWDELEFNNKTPIKPYIDTNYINESYNENWFNLIDDYADCTTPRWYKIVHWDSVLAYKQLENAPDICNIERRYCRNGKLSWTYTQQWCSVNKNYTYDSRWEVETSKEQEKIKWWARQNPDWSVTVKNSEVWWWFVFDKPNRSKTEFSSEENIRHEEEWIEQTSRPYRDCTAPRWEKIHHGQYIYAYKHSNWFSDAPCEVQLRLCTMWELLWTFTESTCKTRDTSFIDWINWSPTRKTYSKEKLELIKKQIKNGEKSYKNMRENATKSTNSASLEKILYILDQ